MRLTKPAGEAGESATLGVREHGTESCVAEMSLSLSEEISKLPAGPSLLPSDKAAAETPDGLPYANR